jgi:hypothetical protein
LINRKGSMTALALALLATPFLFGLARLVTTASDWRYLAVAIASTLGTTIVLRRGNGAAGIARRFVAPFASAALLAAMAALAVGARSATSIVVVAIGFALCSATGAALLVRARGRSNRVG